MYLNVQKKLFFWGGGQIEQMAPLGLPSSTGPAGTEAEDLGSLAVGQGALEVDDRARSSKVTAV